MSASQTRRVLRGRVARRIWIIALGLLGAPVVASGVVAASIDWKGDNERLVEAIGAAPLVRVADIPAANGAPARGVFVQSTSTGHVCVWEAPSASSRERGGGCNTADDPLNGRPVSVVFGYDGGPAVADVRDATLIGLASSQEAGVQVMMSDGTERKMQLHRARVGSDDFWAFGYRFRKGDLRHGVTPVAVVALDSKGAEIGRQTTGF